MKTTKEMIDVMKAYDRGEKIECFNDGYKQWQDADRPIWDWLHNDYRVKPNTKYVPFDTPEEFFAAQRAHGGDSFIRIENGTLKKHDLSVSLDGSVYDHIYDGGVDYIGDFEDLLLEDYKFSDGTPCGKEVKSCQH